MKAYHRIVGDPPQFGFAGAISSVGFPGANWALSVADRRLPPAFGVPYEKEQHAQEGKLMRTQTSFELQALTFDCASVVYSVEAASSSRPHGYSDIVALVPQEGENVTAEQMLTFDNFMKLSEFWELSAGTVSYDASEWQPETAVPNRCPIALSPEMHAALAMRYWRSATARLFDTGRRPGAVRVCLNDERLGVNIIPMAKAFFAAYILPVLPMAARRLVSMSAPVPAKYVTKYDPTALVFLYPEKDFGQQDDKLLFDLRTQSFTALEPDEAAFASLVMSGRVSGYVQTLYERSCTRLGNPHHAHDTAFMADYDIAWSLYQLEYCALSAEKRLTLWRTVQELLTRRHALTNAQADQLLEGFESEWLSKLEKQVIAMQDADFAFLMAKALRNGNRRITDLLILHQQARQKPFFAGLLAKEHLEASTNANIKAVIGALMEEAWLKQPIGQEELETLNQESFYQLSSICPALRACMQSYLDGFGRLHPDKALFIMPLGKQYLEPSGVLKLSIQQLLSQYLQNLPDEVACRSIRESADAMNAENLSLLNAYYVEAYCCHAANALPFVAMCQSMGQDATQALCSILSLDQIKPGALPFPQDSQQLNLTVGGLLPVVKGKAEAHNAMLGYAGRALSAAQGEKMCVLRWFAGLDADGMLIRPAERARMGVEHFVHVYSQYAADPAQGDFEYVKRWMHAADSQQRAYFESLLKPMYNQLAPCGLLQASQLWTAFATLTDAPSLRESYVQMLVRKLESDWASNGYFNAIDAQRPHWALAGVSADELMKIGAVRIKAADKLDRQFAPCLTQNDFDQTFERIQTQTQDAFSEYARQRLNERFGRAYQQMLMTTASVGDVEAANRLCQKLGAQSRISGTEAQKCTDAVVRVNAFFTNHLPGMPDAQLAAQAQKGAQLLNSLPESPMGDHMHGLMNMEAQQLTHLPLRKRMAAALITAGRPLDEHTFHPQNVVAILPWEAENASPFSQKGVALFTQLCALVDLADEINPDYVMLILKAVQRYHPEYGKRIKGVQKQLKEMLPWFPNGNVPKPLVDWINFCANKK